MEFRLLYDGKLRAASRSDTRAKDKHDIRRKLSHQLLLLRQSAPNLRRWFEHDEDWAHIPDSLKPRMPRQGQTHSLIEILGAKYERCGRRYIPLIEDRFAAACSLDILFLRRDYPGGLVTHGGDIDNRIKTLLDGLRLPQDCSEVFDYDETDTDPTFVLLEDDKQIVDLRVSTDRLLSPKADDEHIHDVRLIISVKTVLLDPTKWGGMVY